MTTNNQIKLFKINKIMTLWNKEEQKQYFLVIDVVRLTIDNIIDKFIDKI